MSYPQSPQPERSGMSTGAKIGFGCLGCTGLSAIVVVVLFLAGVFAINEDMDANPPDEAAEDGEGSGDAGGEEEDGGEGGEGEAAFGDGTYTVGEDIDPGTYRTEGPSDDGIEIMCYWARLSGTSGEVDDIIANENLQGPGVVTVEESDAALELSGGCEWTLDE